MPFLYDERLGIQIPDPEVSFEDLPPQEQEEMLVQWETIRARIPDQIIAYEHVIEDLLRKVHDENDWDIIAEHFTEIAEYASRIAELNTWRRIDPLLPSALATNLTEEHRDREK